MKVSRVILAAVILLTAAFSQLKADLPAPLISVDTVFKIKTNGSKGAVFLPDGNSVIMICQDTPYLIDAKTWKVIRQFETKAGQESSNPQISKDGKYLFAESDKGLAVWEILSGKFLKYLRIGADFCLSPDGTKLYSVNMNYNNTGVIRVYDTNTLEQIDLFCDHNFYAATDIACSPDGTTLAVSVVYMENGVMKNSVIMIDLKNKSEYIEIAKMDPNAKNLQFSPDGKNLIYKHIEAISYIALYDIEKKKLNYMYDTDMLNYLNPYFKFNWSELGSGKYLDNNTIEFTYGSNDSFALYEIVWDLQLDKIKKIIKFGAKTMDIYNNKLLLCDPFGNLAQLNLSEVSVGEIRKTDTDYINFLNNQLEFTTDKNFIGELRIFDTTGKIISNLGTQQFIIGKNIISINQPLPSGVYILTIKTKDEQISKKFIVE